MINYEFDKFKFKFCRCGCHTYALSIGENGYAVKYDYLNTKRFYLYNKTSKYDHKQLQEISIHDSMAECKSAVVEYDYLNVKREQIDTILEFPEFSCQILHYRYHPLQQGLLRVHCKVLIISKCVERIIYPFFNIQTGSVYDFVYAHLEEKMNNHYDGKPNHAKY